MGVEATVDKIGQSTSLVDSELKTLLDKTRITEYPCFNSKISLCIFSG